MASDTTAAKAQGERVDAVSRTTRAVDSTFVDAKRREQAPTSSKDVRWRATGTPARPRPEGSGRMKTSTGAASASSSASASEATAKPQPRTAGTSPYERIGRPATPWHSRQEQDVEDEEDSEEERDLSRLWRSPSAVTSSLPLIGDTLVGGSTSASRLRGSTIDGNVLEQGHPIERTSLGRHAHHPRTHTYSETTTTYTFPDPFVAKEALKALREAQVGRRAVSVPSPKSASKAPAIEAEKAVPEIESATVREDAAARATSGDRQKQLSAIDIGRGASVTGTSRSESILFDNRKSAEPHSDLVSSPTEMSGLAEQEYHDRDQGSARRGDEQRGHIHDPQQRSSGTVRRASGDYAQIRSRPSDRSYSDSTAAAFAREPLLGQRHPSGLDASTPSMRSTFRAPRTDLDGPAPVTGISLTAKPLPPPPSALRSRSSLAMTSNHENREWREPDELPAHGASTAIGRPDSTSRAMSLASLRRSLPPILTGSSRQRHPAPLRLRSSLDDSLSPADLGPAATTSLSPSANLARYLATAVFDRWEKWPDPANFAPAAASPPLRDRWRHRRSSWRGERPGSVMGHSSLDAEAQAGRRAVIARLLRDVDRAQAENGGPRSLLKSWRCPSDFFDRVQDCELLLRDVRWKLINSRPSHRPQYSISTDSQGVPME